MIPSLGHNMIDPEALLIKAQVAPGMHVADFGCGRTGQMTFAVSRRVEESGAVYAVDILKDVLENIKKNAQSQGMMQVHPVWSNLECFGKTAIPSGTIDVGFLINALSQMQNHSAIFDECTRTLKEKARLVVVDWHKTGLPFAPKEESFVNFVALRQWAIAHNFVVQEEFDMGPFHHGMVLFRHD